jgi:glycosyltransferase involved in cell wall biosynthesis
LRIGFFTECYHPIANGVVASVDALQEGLRRKGHDVVLITPHVPYYQDIQTNVVRLPSLPLPTSTGYRLTLPASPKQLDARFGVPLDLVHAHSQFITGSLAARYAQTRRLPLVFTYHTRLEFYAHYAPFGGALMRGALAARTRAFANGADAVVVPTEEIRSYLASAGVRTGMEVLPSPVDVERFRAGRRLPELRERWGAGAQTRVVLCVGRLAPEKNPGLAIAACAAAGPHVRLILVGDGPLRRQLEREVRRLGMDGRVCFPGAFAPAEMPDVYASADALLFVSRSETQGLVLVEALATGLPVIAVDSPVTNEILAGLGQTVASEPGVLAAALDAFVPSGPDQSAIQLALERFSIEVQARRLASLYRRIAAGT